MRVGHWAPDLRRARTGGQHGWTCKWLAHLARQSLLSLRSTACSCEVLEGGETAGCHLIHMVLVSISHSHSKRNQASTRARRWSWRARNEKRILFAQPQIQEQIVDVPVLRFMEEIVEIVAGELVCNF